MSGATVQTRPGVRGSALRRKKRNSTSRSKLLRSQNLLWDQFILFIFIIQLTPSPLVESIAVNKQRYRCKDIEVPARICQAVPVSDTAAAARPGLSLFTVILQRGVWISRGAATLADRPGSAGTPQQCPGSLESKQPRLLQRQQFQFLQQLDSLF